jgi:hypothetical protein
VLFRAECRIHPQSWCQARVPYSSGHLGRVHCRLGGACLVDLDTANGPTINCLDFGLNRVMTVSTLPKGTRIIKEEGSVFSISPDGRWILYVDLKQQESDIMMVDNFR